MRGYELKRWQRVLIVLSLFWMFFGGVWGWRHAYDQADATFKLCVTAIPATTLQSCRAERARALAVPRGVSAAVAALAPIAAFWLLVYGLIAFARRIRRGFAPQFSPAGAAVAHPSVLPPTPAPAKLNPGPLAAAVKAEPSAGGKEIGLSPNKRTVEKYLEAFRRSDHQQILSCLTDDVEWVIPGLFHIKGKDAFDKEIENEAFIGSPAITVRLTEEGNVVVAEGSVRAARREGGYLDAVFCDVFEMHDAKIRRLVSYLTEVKVAQAEA